MRRALHRGDLPQQGLLGRELQRAVDRQHHIVARLRGLDALASDGDRATLRVALVHQSSRHTGEPLVVLAFDARHALAVDVDTPDDRASQLAGR